MSQRPLPTALKIIRGTTRKDRINKDEPKPKIETPDVPPGLSPAALVEWDRISPALESMGLLTGIDMAALAGYCELYARWQKAEQKIQDGGEVVTTPNGSLQVSPWVSIAHRSLAEMRKYLSEFGLSPASRSKVTANKKPDKPNKFASNDPERFFK